MGPFRRASLPGGSRIRRGREPAPRRAPCDRVTTAHSTLPRGRDAPCDPYSCPNPHSARDGRRESTYDPAESRRPTPGARRLTLRWSGRTVGCVTTRAARTPRGTGPTDAGRRPAQETRQLISIRMIMLSAMANAARDVRDARGEGEPGREGERERQACAQHQRAAERAGEHGDDRGGTPQAALPVPPARVESAARPVIVSVSTVVVRSGTARRRTVALRMPMPAAMNAIVTSPATVAG